MKLSKIIAGTMTWGQWGKQMSKQDMQNSITHCLDNGITTFDHADIYGGYTTENQFGEAISELQLKRSSYELITKCGIQYQSENRNNKVKHYDYSKAYIIWSVDQSLLHLQTEYIDCLLLHRPSPLIHPDEIAEAINSLKAQGKIKRFGVSNFTQSQMNLISSRIDIEINQIECSLTHYHPMHDGTLDYMLSNSIAAMAWSPLGSLFKVSNDQTGRIKEVMKGLTEKYQLTDDQLALAWLLKHPAQIRPVIGTTNPKRIKLATEAISVNLELEDWFLLLVASQGHKVP